LALRNEKLYRKLATVESRYEALQLKFGEIETLLPSLRENLTAKTDKV
jgi:hypothetical protein